jgi:hypothetical protein
MRQRELLWLGSVIFLLMLWVPKSPSQEQPPTQTPAKIERADNTASSTHEQRDRQQDFDFVIGKWKIRNRRLVQPLSGSDEWQEFESTSVARQVWDGHANIDEYEGDSPAGHIEGITLRLYNPKSHQWSLYWGTSKNGSLSLPATVGEFKDGRGEFYDQEEFKGKDIFVRYVWSGITANTCRWEQAFSSDGGKTWETNWIMDMTRQQ